LFSRWWNCPSPYIKWNMSWWSRTCEELGIITRHPYITFSSLSLLWYFDAPSISSNDYRHAFEALFFNIFLPLFSSFLSSPLSSLVPSLYSTTTTTTCTTSTTTSTTSTTTSTTYTTLFLASLRARHEMSRTSKSSSRCPVNDRHPSHGEQELDDQLTQE
jgi:hypothetical protein